MSDLDPVRPALQAPPDEEGVRPESLEAAPRPSSSFEPGSEREVTEAALRESEAKFKLLFERSRDGLLLLEGDRFTECNPAVLEMMRCSHPEFLRLHPWELSPPFQPDGRESSEKAPEMIRLAYERGSHRFEWTHLRMDGEPFPVEVTLTVIPWNEKEILYTTWRDITESKLAEEERQRLRAQLEHSQKMESLGSLAGGVAHDMNNVLAAILMLASSNLDCEPEDSRAHRAFDSIAKAATRAGKLVAGLLNFSRKGLAEEQEVDLNKLVREEIQLLEHTTMAQVSLAMELHPDLRPLRGDAGALSHLLMNLCINALDAMKQQPGQRLLTIRTRNEGENVVLEVEDSGCGMTKEIKDRALDPFFTTKPQGQGTGLGLAIAYRTVKAHKGDLDILSEPGRGTRFLIRLPACAPSIQAAEAAPEPQPLGLPNSLEILLVDDDLLVSETMQKLLQRLGCAVTPAFSGEEAMVLVENGLQPHLIILDMNMPGIGGAGALPRLRSLLPLVPVLLATGRVEQSVLNLVQAHPGVTLLPKPFSLADLRKHLAKLGAGTS